MIGSLGASGVFAVADGASGLEAAHDRHLNVHDDDVEAVVRRRLDGPDRRPPVFNGAHLVPALLQQRDHQLAVDRVVFGNQDLQALCRRAAWPVCRQFGLSANGRGEDVRQRVEQIRVFDRFGQARLDADLPAALRMFGLSERSEHDDRRAGQVLIPLDFRREVEAIHFGHLTVGDDDVEACMWLPRLAQLRQGGARVVNGRRLHVPAREHGFEDAAVGRVVVDDQNAQALE